MPKRGAGKQKTAAVVERPREPTLLDAVAQINSIKLQQLSLMKEAKRLKEENEELCKRLVQAEEICKRLGRAEQEAVRQQVAIELTVPAVAASSQVTLPPVAELKVDAVEINEKDSKMTTPQEMQDKGEPLDDQVMVQLPECHRRSAGLLFWSADPICDVVVEASGADEGIGGNAEVVVELVEPAVEEEEQEMPFVSGTGITIDTCKLPVFDNNGVEFVKWSREAMHYMDSVCEGLSAFLSGALDADDAMNGQEGDTETVVLKHSQEEAVSVTGSELEKMSSQVYYLLIDLTDGESLDLVMSAGEGQGLEAWRKLNRRWDPGATGSADMLWYSIFRPKKAQVGNLEASIERLEDLMRRYMVKRPTKGDFVLSSFKEETKITCLLKLLPEELEQYVRPDKFQLSSYSLIREEAIRCAEELQVTGGHGRVGKGKGSGKGKDLEEKGEGKEDDLEEEGKCDDVVSEKDTSTRPKGKGKTDMWNVKCHRCKNWGHYARDCQYECTQESRGEAYKKMIQCYNCRKWGHYAKDCWANTVDDRDEELQSWKKPAGDKISRDRIKKIQCFNCQRWGHYARDCWWKEASADWPPKCKPPPPPPPVLEVAETVEAETVCVACTSQKQKAAEYVQQVKEADAIYRNHRAERDEYEECLKKEAKEEVHAAEEIVEANVAVEKVQRILNTSRKNHDTKQFF